MGRYYSGSIEGKFWFGVQGSCDIEELTKVVGETNYSWLVCGCNAEIEDDVYCKQCYQYKEQHIEDAIQEGNFDEDADEVDKCLYYECQMITYCLDKSSHYQDLVDSMNTIKTQIPEETLADFDKIEQNDDILDAFTGIFDNIHNSSNTDADEKEKHNLCVLIARYTLGYQIEYCLRTQSTCNVVCEY
jgi:hypothetical protein